MNADKVEARKFSFRSDKTKGMNYTGFLEVQKDNTMGVAIKENSPNITELLLEDIEVPTFYKDVADVSSVTLYHGSNFIDKPHYLKDEQIVCAVDSAVSLALIPHVHRQEAYTGDLKNSVYWDPLITKRGSQNVSPVNFFMPNK